MSFVDHTTAVSLGSDTEESGSEESGSEDDLPSIVWASDERTQELKTQQEEEARTILNQMEHELSLMRDNYNRMRSHTKFDSEWIRSIDSTRVALNKSLTNMYNLQNDRDRLYMVKDKTSTVDPLTDQARAIMKGFEAFSITKLETIFKKKEAIHTKEATIKRRRVPEPKSFSSILREKNMLNQTEITLEDFRNFFAAMDSWNKDGFEEISHFRDSDNGFGGFATAYGTQCVFDVWRRFEAYGQRNFSTMTLTEYYDLVEWLTEANHNVVGRANQFIISPSKGVDPALVAKWATVIHRFVSKYPTVEKVIRKLSHIHYLLENRYKNLPPFHILYNALKVYTKDYMMARPMNDKTFKRTVDAYRTWQLQV